MRALVKPPARTALTTHDDPRWQALERRDATADGSFFYSVQTTGVYCRPSCAARLPNPKNVAFHASWQEAERAGFRACKRCQPKEPPREARQAQLVAEACRLLEQAPSVPPLAELAQHAGLSPHHFHRLFKLHTGLTPRAYAAARREERVRDNLTGQSSVTRALYDAGFGSSGHFYEASRAALGMTPSSYRSRGAGERIRFGVGQCSLGSLLVASSDKGVCAILLGDDPEQLLCDLQDRFSNAELVGGDRAFEQLMARVVGLVEAPQLGVDLPLDLRGSAFQKRVWQALREIPAGSTESYGALARRIGAAKAVRAVGSACGKNPLAIAIPCHRVVRNDGALSGYRWGLERKRALLEREAAR